MQNVFVHILIFYTFKLILRIVEHRGQVASIREVASRRRLKVAFFGRTSSGKSSVINALLGEAILPTGLGHTTANFVRVQGTKSSEKSIVRDDEEIDSTSIGLSGSHPIDILWPRGRCKLLKNDDVVLIDSPGVDVDADFDTWIDEECSDADLFVLVLNAESTLMMREKDFFHKVAAKIAKPNILVLLNRWDCSDEVPLVQAEAVREQHLSRASEFLTYELKVAASLDEAKRQVFFISAKEALKNDDSNGDTSKLLRIEEWQRFGHYIEACLDIAVQGAKYGPLLDAGREVANELDKIQDVINKNARRQSESKLVERDALKSHTCQLVTGMEKVTEDWKKIDLQRLSTEVENLVHEAFQAEVEDNFAQMVYDFEAPFSSEDTEVIKMYKTQLVHHVEASFALGLKMRLSLQLSCLLQDSQAMMLQKLDNMLPPQIVVDIQMPRIETIIEFAEAIPIFGISGLTHFQNQPVNFQFSLGPGKLINHCLGYYQKLRGNEINESLVYLKHDESWTSWAKVLMTSAAIIAEGQLACAGLAMKYFGSSKAAFRVLISMGFLYLGLYGYERTSWTWSGKQRQIKNYLLSIAADNLPLAAEQVVLDGKTQVRHQTNTFLGIACGSLESIHIDMKNRLEILQDELESTKEVVDTCANLSNTIQGILFDFDSVERIILNMTR